MTGPEALSDALRFLDEELLEEADKVRRKRRRQRQVCKWAAVFACGFLTVVLGTAAWGDRSRRSGGL